MLTVARPTSDSSSDIVDLLIDCHDRVRSFIVLLRRFGEASELPPAQVADAAERLRRYFRIALPLHSRDEEESVLPRLKGLDAQLDEQLEAMCNEHDAHEPVIEALLKACDRLVAEPARHAEMRDELRALAVELERLFAEHIQREEWVIFPAVQARLDLATRNEMVRELRARRAAV